jgi:hypothetical protein
MGLEVMKMMVLRFKNMGFDTDMQDLKGQKKTKTFKTLDFKQTSWPFINKGKLKQ